MKLTFRIKFYLVFSFLSLFTLSFINNNIQGDGGTYIGFAENILNGYYANPDLNPGFLWYGPGYPLVITPFLYFNLPYLFIKILNIFFIYFGVYYLYKNLSLHIPKNIAFFGSLLSLTHPFLLDALTRVLTEAMVFFLISYSFYSFSRYIKSSRIKFLLLSGISSFLLIITKVFFAYVYLAFLSLVLLYYILKKKEVKFLYFSTIPLLLSHLYLIYTFSITSNYFYWGDSGGSSLYSMSTLYENEYGDWFPPNIDKERKKVIYSSNPSRTTIPLKGDHFQKHYKFLDSISDMTGIEKDKSLKTKAFENIKENPSKFLKNVFYNNTRLLFRTPFSNRELKPFYKFIFFTHGTFVLIGLLFSLWSLLFKEKKIEFKFIGLFLLIYLGGMSLLSASPRFLFPVYGLFILILVRQIHLFYLQPKFHE